MIIFINDIPVRILKADEQPDLGKVNVVIDAAESPLTQAQLIHHVWIKNVEDEHLNVLLHFLDSKIPTSLLSLYLTVKNCESGRWTCKEER
jgi:8-oxo-(d)GTP phosphatase